MDAGWSEAGDTRPTAGDAGQAGLPLCPSLLAELEGPFG